jgi:hypothetical protein
MSLSYPSVFPGAELEPGDRFEVAPIGSTGRLSLPRVVGPAGFPIEQIEDPAGRPLDLSLDLATGSLAVPRLGEAVSRSAASALWLEYRAPGRFRLIVEPGAPHPADGAVVTEQGVPIDFDAADWPVVEGASPPPAGLEQFDLAIQAARLATHAGFDRLIALPMVRDIELLEHQIRTAKTVLRRFRGRAMLCDEVGLGKTIEAGLVLSELMIRGLARSVLVLVPPSLIEQWQGEGHDVAVFHGGLSRLEKEAAIERFRGRARILLCTEAGSEGRNLQFAHAVCNFDLPWNPMKIEQRIGRLSRIGQTHDVHVFNLVAADTVEAAVLHLLEAKLNMFELVIGEVDMILGNLEDEREFPDVVADLWAESTDQDEFSRRIEDLGDRLLEAKKAYFEQRAIDDKLFGNRFAPDQ